MSRKQRTYHRTERQLRTEQRHKTMRTVGALTGLFSVLGLCTWVFGTEAVHQERTLQVKLEDNVQAQRFKASKRAAADSTAASSPASIPSFSSTEVADKEVKMSLTSKPESTEMSAADTALLVGVGGLVVTLAGVLAVGAANKRRQRGTPEGYDIATGEDFDMSPDDIKLYDLTAKSHLAAARHEATMTACGEVERRLSNAEPHVNRTGIIAQARSQLTWPLLSARRESQHPNPLGVFIPEAWHLRKNQQTQELPTIPLEVLDARSQSQYRQYL